MKRNQKSQHLEEISVILQAQKVPANKIEIQTDSAIEPGDARTPRNLDSFQSDRNVRSQRLRHRLEQTLVHCMVLNMTCP
jgi:hypothetical protein